MRQVGGDQLLELGDELMNFVGSEIQTKQLDGNQPVFFGLVRTKYRAQSPRTDLMKYAKWSEGVRRRSTDSVRVQRALLKNGTTDRNTETRQFLDFLNPLEDRVRRSRCVCAAADQREYFCMLQ